MPDFTVSEAGERLDVLVARETGMSRALASRLIDEGAVTVDGTRARRSLKPDPGARVSVRIEEPVALVPEDIDVRIVYEDDVLMVVSKPAGLVVHPAPGHDAGTLVHALIARGARGGAPERPGIVHRLDAGTSGLMIVAKDEDAYERLSDAMAARQVTRTYLALVEGTPKTERLTIDAPVGRSPRHRQKMAVVAGGRDALTHVTVLERHVQTSLVEARPHTGRTHQIRVHLAAAEHAVVGDRVYGTKRALARALSLDRPFLHAASLAFDHPATGARLELEDPLPAELVDALERARALAS